MPKRAPQPQITRIELNLSWRVQIWPSDSRNFLADRHFSDAVYGSKQDSLDAACQFLDSLLSQHRIVPHLEKNADHARHATAGPVTHNLKTRLMRINDLGSVLTHKMRMNDAYVENARKIDP
ncbi:MAG: hypothetical protein ACLPXB_16150 [Thiobacillaceae bacterium]